MAGGDARRRDGAAHRVRAPQLGPLPGSPCVLPSRAQYRARGRAPSWRAGRRCARTRPGTRPTTSRSRPRAARRPRRATTTSCARRARAARSSPPTSSTPARYLRWLRALPRGGRGRPAAVGPAQLLRRHLRRDDRHRRGARRACPGSCGWRRRAGSSSAATPPGASCSRATRTAPPARSTAAFALARTRPRIERMYVYQWRAGARRPLRRRASCAPTGAQRPSYAAFAARDARAAASGRLAGR